MRVMKNIRRATLCAALPLAAAFAVLGTSLAAQTEGTATLRGTVFDSTSMAALAGARVAVIGTIASTTADDAGRFELTGIPAGTHWVSFFHPRLQTLGVSPPSRQVAFRDGETKEMVLAVPSEATLVLGWCMAEQPGPGYAVVAGMVTDSLTGVPMPRAIVTAAPVRRTVGAPAPTEVRTDDAGYYRLCSVPAGTEMKIQAHFGRNSGRSVNLTLQPGTAAMQDLMLLMSAEGTLKGFVRDYISGQPIAGAEVDVLGTHSSTLTDVDGRFMLDDLPPGRHLVQTKHLAYAEQTDSVTVFSQETVDIQVRMATEALEVEGLVVTARSRFGRTSLAGDAKRADFMSREEIEKILPRVTSPLDLMRAMNVPGFRVREVNQADALTGAVVPGVCIEVSRRSGGEGCSMAAVMINDVIVPYPDQILRELDPQAIDRIEILSPVDAQFQFGTIAGNGAVLIYTR
jgi:Carboxypeptidase regulatory-like domain